jgi:hypothetical protein
MQSPHTQEVQRGCFQRGGEHPQNEQFVIEHIIGM